MGVLRSIVYFVLCFANEYRRKHRRRKSADTNSLQGDRSRNVSLGSLLANFLKELVRLLVQYVDPFDGESEHLGDLVASTRGEDSSAGVFWRA